MKKITAVPSYHEFIVIYCNKLNGSDRVTVPVDMFNFVPFKPQVEKRVQEWQDGKKLQDRRVNVVILGIDANSHMNFHRVMPKTIKYITEELNAIGMDGYTKVGDNTFPNIGKSSTTISPQSFLFNACVRVHCACIVLYMRGWNCSSSSLCFM